MASNTSRNIQPRISSSNVNKTRSVKLIFRFSYLLHNFLLSTYSIKTKGIVRVQLGATTILVSIPLLMCGIVNVALVRADWNYRYSHVPVKIRPDIFRCVSLELSTQPALQRCVKIWQRLVSLFVRVTTVGIVRYYIGRRTC